MRFLLISIILISLLPHPCIAAETKKQNQYDLNKDDVAEYRAIEADIRAITAEAKVAIMELDRQRNDILKKWQKMTGEEDLSGWELNLKDAKLTRKAKSK